MTKSTKAALLSALVFPGVGHFYLKHRLPGAVLAGVAFASFYWIIARLMERALEITGSIQRGEVAPDMAAIMELVAEQPTGDEARLITIAWTVLIITWLIGIIDSYRRGRI